MKKPKITVTGPMKDEVEQVQTGVVTEEVPPETTYDDLEDNADILKIRQILQAADVTGGQVRISRKGPTDQVYQYVARIPIEQFDYEHIKKVYGGGDYKCQTFRANGQMYKPFEFSVDYRFKGALDDGQIKQLATQAKDDGGNGAMIAAAINRSQSNDQLTQIMRDSAKQTETFMMLMMKMMSDSSERQMAMMQGMFQAMSNRPAPPQIDFSSAITPVLVEMIRSKASVETPFMEQIKAFKAIKETFGPEPGSEPEPPDMLTKLITSLAPAVLPMITGQPTRPALPAGVSPRLPNQTVQSPNPQAAAMKQISMFIDMLCEAADRNADPAIYADLINVHLNEMQIDQLRATLTGDDWIDKLFGRDERIMGRISWFTDLRQLIIDENDTSNEQGHVDADAGLPAAAGSSSAASESNPANGSR